MDDGEIIELYWRRDRNAISETDTKYGSLCRSISRSVLALASDAEENVNDTYFTLWSIIPPQRPLRFPAFISRVARNLALKKHERMTAAKRSPRVLLSLSELEECVSGRESDLDAAERAELTAIIEDFLRGLPTETRVMFLKRYFYFLSVEETAKQTGVSPTKVTTALYRARKALKKRLMEEGYYDI